VNTRSVVPSLHERINRGQHLFRVERRQPTDPMERQVARFAGEDAIRHERVEVDVQVDCNGDMDRRPTHEGDPSRVLWKLKMA
jgi:hypothetical protein